MTEAGSYNQIRIRPRKCFLVVFFSSLIFLFPESRLVLAGASDTVHFTVKGYMEDLQTVTFVDDPDSIVSGNILHNRLNLRLDLGSRWYTRLEIRNRLFYGEALRTTPGFSALLGKDAGYLQLSKIWLDRKSILIHSIVDRAFIAYSSPKTDVRIGRQRINWGITNFWNPNDLFNAYNFLDYDYVERPGSDALRIQYFANSFTTLEAAWKPGKKADEQVTAVLYKTNKFKYDLQLLGGLYYNDLVLGTGWAGNILDAGFKGEITWFYSLKQDVLHRNNFSISAMLDYSFEKGYYCSAGLLYVTETSYALAGNTTDIQDFSAKRLMPFHMTYSLSVSKEFSPVLSASLTPVYAPHDNNLILLPSLTYSLSGNSDFTLGAQSFYSSAWEPFQVRGNLVFGRLKINF